jgi:hypothetical protein
MQLCGGLIDFDALSSAAVLAAFWLLAFAFLFLCLLRFDTRNYFFIPVKFIIMFSFTSDIVSGNSSFGELKRKKHYPQ